MTLFASDHDGKLPWNVPQQEGGSKEYTNYPQVFRHFIVASNELNTPKILTCRADGEKARTDEFSSLTDSNVSYFVALSTDGKNTNGLLMGDRNLVGGTPATAKLRSFNASTVVSWSEAIHEKGGNPAFVDGSAQHTTIPRLQQVVRSNSVPLMRLAIP